MRTIVGSYKEECFDKGLVQGMEQVIEKGMQAVVEKTAIYFYIKVPSTIFFIVALTAVVSGESKKLCLILIKEVL